MPTISEKPCSRSLRRFPARQRGERLLVSMVTTGEWERMSKNDCRHFALMQWLTRHVRVCHPLPVLAALHTSPQHVWWPVARYLDGMRRETRSASSLARSPSSVGQVTTPRGKQLPCKHRPLSAGSVALQTPVSCREHATLWVEFLDRYEANYSRFHLISLESCFRDTQLVFSSLQIQMNV